MKSGLDGRNNSHVVQRALGFRIVSMKSGLDGRNNKGVKIKKGMKKTVSMKSGLDGRNNWSMTAVMAVMCVSQ